ncbi:hypothetical protein [Pseudomonas phage PH826]|uniref:Uncharacterized protein n=1 Tax=Pseudomonas phage KPP10 TaxID=582345 RepID=D6RRJ4_BPKPP|nr:hypothetical protein KPP10_gp039 [Pseudomonas phage KPP10]UVD32685.1 hypothetical protein [Pseudomonas phage PH826]BAJ09158.1 hypothetical protein [Pseudomonas phage KPP10]
MEHKALEGVKHRTWEVVDSEFDGVYIREALPKVRGGYLIEYVIASDVKEEHVATLCAARELKAELERLCRMSESSFILLGWEEKDIESVLAPAKAALALANKNWEK